MNIIDQPPPVANEGRAVWTIVIEDVTRDYRDRTTVALVLADMRQRDAIGRERYGTPLQTHNGRDALVDAYQEALDLVVYLRQAIEEGTSVRDAYSCALDVVSRLRLAIARRPIGAEL